MNKLQNQMGKSEQKFIILDLWKENLRLKRIRADMKQTLGPDKSSNAQIARWASRCEEGDF
jgi:hypothetical protein